jgi:hypothetical protein
MYINADIPPIKCFIRKEFLYDQKAHHNELEEVIIFGVCGLQGLAPLFHCMSSFGAVWFRQPIHAFVWRDDVDHDTLLSLDDLCLWNSFSNSISVHRFKYLTNMRCDYFGRNKTFIPGSYVLTLDWCNQHGEFSFAETPDEYKCHHMIKLDNGQFALQPNNRMKWYEPAFVVNPFPDKPDFKVNTHVWSAENGSKWVTENSDHMFYTIEDKESDDNLEESSERILYTIEDAWHETQSVLYTLEECVED